MCCLEFMNEVLLNLDLFLTLFFMFIDNCLQDLQIHNDHIKQV